MRTYARAWAHVYIKSIWLLCSSTGVLWGICYYVRPHVCSEAFAMSVHTYVMRHLLLCPSTRVFMRHYVRSPPCYEVFVVMSVNMCVMRHLVLCPSTRVFMRHYVRPHQCYEAFAVMFVSMCVMRHLLLCPSTRVFMRHLLCPPTRVLWAEAFVIMSVQTAAVLTSWHVSRLVSL